MNYAFAHTHNFLALLWRERAGEQSSESTDKQENERTTEKAQGSRMRTDKITSEANMHIVCLPDVSVQSGVRYLLMKGKIDTSR